MGPSAHELLLSLPMQVLLASQSGPTPAPLPGRDDELASGSVRLTPEHLPNLHTGVLTLAWSRDKNSNIPSAFRMHLMPQSRSMSLWPDPHLQAYHSCP